MLYEARRNAEQDQEEITWIERSILAADSLIGNMPGLADVVSLPLFALRGCDRPVPRARPSLPIDGKQGGPGLNSVPAS